MTGNDSRRIVVTIYRFTGQHGPFNVPHHKCVECDLSIALVNRTVEEIGQGHIDVRVKSWFSALLGTSGQGRLACAHHHYRWQGVQPRRRAGSQPATLRVAPALGAPRRIPGS